MTLILFTCRSLTQAFNFIFVLPNRWCRDSQLIKPRQGHYLSVVSRLIRSLGFWWAASHTAPWADGSNWTQSPDHRLDPCSEFCHTFFTLYGHHRVMPAQKNSNQPRIILTDLFWLLVFLPHQEPLQDH